MNILKLTIMVSIVGVVGGCEKQSNTKLAHAYFKMAFTELGDDADPVAAHKRALVSINKALELQEKAEYYALKATVLFNLGDSALSQTCYQKALALQPEQAMRGEIVNNYACLLAHQKQYDQARTMWKGLTKDALYQTPEVAFVNLGRLYAEEKNYMAAKESFQNAVHIAPSYLDAQYYLGLMAHKLGDSQLAAKQTKMLLSLEPTHQGAQWLAAQLRLDVPGSDEA